MSRLPPPRLPGVGPALPAPGRPDLPAPVPAPGPAADASAAIDVEILTDEGISQTVRGVEEEIISIGRSAENRIVLPNPAVSRRHAEILREESGLVLHNFSVNGALVGEREVPEDHHEPFELGEEICIGPFRLTCRPARAPSRTGRGSTAARAQLGPGTAPVPPPGQALMRAEPRSGPASVVQRPEQATGQRAAVPAPHAGSAEPAISVRAELLSQGGSQVRRPPAAVPDRRSHPPAAGGSGVGAQESGLSVAIHRELHKELLERLDLQNMPREELADAKLRPRVLAELDAILADRARRPLGEGGLGKVDLELAKKELADEALGLGPLEDMLADDRVTEIMVVDRETIYVEREGRLDRSPKRFSSDDAVRAAIERIVTPLGRRIDESSPLVDARLKDGSRVNAVIPPLALRGPTLTIRKFGRRKMTMDDLLQFGSVNERIGRFLRRAVLARKNIVISGGTGSGKTTLLNILSSAIPEHERIVTIEDAAELRLHQPHVVGLETRPANLEGKGEYSIRDLLRNALRMRPDRIVVGECRGGEALDMLQAMNTGHDGSLTTTHANSPIEAIARLETLVLMAGLDLPSRAIREQIAQSVDLVVQQARLSDGARRITDVAEVVGISEHGDVALERIFHYEQTGVSNDGRVIGEFRHSGYLPSFLGEFETLGLVRKGEPYL